MARDAGADEARHPAPAVSREPAAERPAPARLKSKKEHFTAEVAEDMQRTRRQISPWRAAPKIGQAPLWARFDGRFAPVTSPSRPPRNLCVLRGKELFFLAITRNGR